MSMFAMVYVGFCNGQCLFLQWSMLVSAMVNVCFLQCSVFVFCNVLRTCNAMFLAGLPSFFAMVFA